MKRFVCKDATMCVFKVWVWVSDEQKIFSGHTTKTFLKIKTSDSFCFEYKL
jgi:hypothetical protein